MRLCLKAKWKIIWATNPIPANYREEKETTNRRNGYFDKTIKTSMGETAKNVPRDRQASFESVIFPKHKQDVSDIENKMLTMYACVISQRDISATIDDIYDFKLSAEQISKITDMCSKNKKIGKIERLHRSTHYFLSTVSSCPLNAIMKQRNTPFTTSGASV